MREHVRGEDPALGARRPRNFSSPEIPSRLGMRPIWGWSTTLCQTISLPSSL